MIISSINYFCSYTIGTLLNIAKLHVSKYLQSCHITINKFYSQWPHKLFTLQVLWMFIKNFACCFFSCLLYFTNERWVSQILSLHVCMISFSMLNQLQLLIECSSDILGTCFDFFDNLKQSIYIKESYWKKKTFFSCHKGLTRF